jgi:hypothetical protein
MSPVIILDIYYGYNDKSCVDYYSNNLNIRLKEYLLVSGYVNLLLTSIILSIIIILNKENGQYIRVVIDFYNIYIDSWIMAFITAWNIIGSIIFWSQIYPKNICNLDISLYLFISLIVKLAFYFILFCIKPCLF